MTDLVQWDWQRIADAVEQVAKESGVKQIKAESKYGTAWTVYRTAGCIRIDIHHKGEN